MDSISPKAVFGPSNPSPIERVESKVKRFASVIGLCSEKEAYYRELHANVWPSILEHIKLANLQNFSIHLTKIEGKKYLFSYYEYTGTHYEEDMKLMGTKPEMQRWWEETSPCQFLLPNTKTGKQWKEMEMLFRQD
ncbi:MAG: L-rhamnose mutarotase [Opitutales bacterium]|nr:L-rhamnose mutarotase [Opitutales bacterium]